MRDRFQVIIPATLAEEGGYVIHPNDPGGETKFGISKRKFPALDIRNLTREQAIEIYHREYWLAFRCGEFPPGLDFAMFDAAVQHLPKVAGSLVQRAIGGLKPDGAIGPITLAAANRCNVSVVLNRYFMHRAGFYMDLIVANSTSAVFRDGWFARLFRLQAFILQTTALPQGPHV